MTPTPRNDFFLFFFLDRVTFLGGTGADRENSGQVFGNRLSESKIKLPNYGGEWNFLFLHPVYFNSQFLHN